jgi:hypothetical protein
VRDVPQQTTLTNPFERKPSKYLVSAGFIDNNFTIVFKKEKKKTKKTKQKNPHK